MQQISRTERTVNRLCYCLQPVVWPALILGMFMVNGLRVVVRRARW